MILSIPEILERPGCKHGIELASRRTDGSVYGVAEAYHHLRPNVMYIILGRRARTASQTRFVTRTPRSNSSSGCVRSMRPRQEAKCNKYSTVVDDALPFDDDKRDAIIDRSEPRTLCERIAGRADNSILPMVDHEESQSQ
jgi:hypothetical protein